MALVLVVRPLAGWLALTVMARAEDKEGGLDRGEAAAVAFSGVRGVGSLYYLGYAAQPRAPAGRAVALVDGGLHRHRLGAAPRRHGDARRCRASTRGAGRTPAQG